MNLKQKLIDLAATRTAALDRATAAYEANNQADYTSAMQEVDNLNAEIDRVNNLVREQERRVIENAPTGAEARDIAEERGNILRNHGVVQFSTLDVLRGIRNATTLATGTIVEPTGAGTEIRDLIGNAPSSIVNQVYVQDMTGMGGFSEPYVISELDAKTGKVTTNAGKARTASADPTFGVAKSNPYEMNVTTYVDRNINRLSPANYYSKIYAMAMNAMYRKLAELIVNGDGQATPDMFGIKTAKNAAGAAIYATENISTIDENLLDTLYFAYGGDSELGTGARLYLTKADLKAIGKLRNSNKERVFKVIHDPDNHNTGRIEDGGNSVPYCIVSSLTSLSGATASSSADIQTMLYGDPLNYELGLFGDYSIRVDEGIKGEERMLTLLGDAMVGGNIIRHKGFVIATLPKTVSGG